jgi:hypothetical protein
MFSFLNSYMSRVFPRPAKHAAVALALLAATGCDQIDRLGGFGDPRICGVPPWYGSEARNDAERVNRRLALCLWRNSRLLARAPATNDELARAIVGGCWDRVSAWGRISAPGADMETIDRVVARLQLQSLYWVVEARAGGCTLRTHQRKQGNQLGEWLGVD